LYKLKETDLEQCWWCETGKRQTRDHRFKECRRWKTEINVLWTTIGKKLGWKHRRNKKISELFRQGKATGRYMVTPSLWLFGYGEFQTGS